MHSRHALCHDVHVRLGLYQRNTRPQSPRNEDRMMFVVDLIALERERHGKIVNAAIGSPRRKHPHDGVEFTIESNLPPYNATVGGRFDSMVNSTPSWGCFLRGLPIAALTIDRKSTRLN